MNAMGKKLLSLLLVLTMLLGMMPAVFASDELPAEPEELAEQLLQEETDEAEDAEDANEPVDGEEPGNTEEPIDPEIPAEEPEDPDMPEDPDVPEESEEGEEPEEDEEPAELPYGFPGMGEEYALSEAELAAKLAIAGLPERLAALTPGVDYVEGELIIAAGSEAYAQLVADAYDAELLDFDGAYALLSLRGATVLQAVECAADPVIPLPAAEPNYIAQSTCIPGEVISADEIEVQGERQDWYNWMDFGMDDPWISDPSDSSVYQYHHDILGDYAAWGVGMGYGVGVAVISYAHADELQELICGSYSDGRGVGVAPRANVGKFYPSYNTAYYYRQELSSMSASYKIVLLDASFPEVSETLRVGVTNCLNNGCLVVVPMGDNGACCLGYPASYENDRVIAVAATNPNGSRAGFSNYGDWCDISAPGIAPSGSGSYSGTFYAAALVAGAAALYVGVFGPILGEEQAIRDFPAAMRQAATKGGVGAGILNTANLFTSVIPNTPSIYSIYGYYNYDSKNVLSVSEDSSIEFWTVSPGDNVDFYYTTDGKTPTVKNGKVTLGLPMYGDTLTVDALDLPLGKAVTLKVIALNGLGIPSKVFTQKIRLVEYSGNETIAMADPYGVGSSSSNPFRISAGGSYTLKAEVRPLVPGYKVSQSVEWEIVSQVPSDLGAKLDAKTGKLTTKAGKTGTVEVTAFHRTDDSGMFLPFYVEVTAANKIKTLTANKKSITVDRYFGGSSDWNNDLFVAAKDAAGSPLAIPGDVQISWTSSNQNVVSVNTGYHGANPTLQPMGKGTATVKGTAMDGSGKSVSVKVTVVQHVTGLKWYFKDPDIDILAPGGSVSLIAEVLPADANNRGVEWSVYKSNGMNVKISSKGVVTMPKNAVLPDSKRWIQVKALSKDSGETWIETIQVRQAAASFEVHPISSPFENAIQYDKNWNIKGVTLITRDLPLTTDNDEDRIYLQTAYDTESDFYMEDNACTSYQSSNENVAYAYRDWDDDLVIQAQGPGSCKVTLTTRDGLKKYTIAVKVIAPVAGIQLSSAAPNGTNVVAYGKSFKLSAKTFDTYGKPTDTKLRWEIARVENKFGSEIYSSQYGKLLSISKSGVLTVKKGAADLDLRYVDVEARPASYTPYDDSELCGSFRIYVTDPIRKIEIGAYPIFALDPDTPTFNGAVKLNDETLPIDSSWDQLISVTSSNPRLVRARLEQDGYNKYYVYLEARKSDFTAKKATVKITVKANDGFGKSASFKVTLQKP